jgi:hypothetical protein
VTRPHPVADPDLDRLYRNDEDDRYRDEHPGPLPAPRRRPPVPSVSPDPEDERTWRLVLDVVSAFRAANRNLRWVAVAALAMRLADSEPTTSVVRTSARRFAKDATGEHGRYAT